MSDDLIKRWDEYVEHMARQMRDRIEQLEAKLAKTVEKLREIEADCDADYPPSHGAIKYAIRTVLAELEGREEAAVTAWKGRE